MADRRKLQGEIERCLKKVNEGVETFEDIWQKVHNAANANQKEKYEADLKKEIKKLQRLRDQIKTWCASSEIKDKRALVENRKLIETQMERFKVVERETKTKAYSKEGLGAAQKLDPAQKEKDEITNWLSSSIDTLSVQVDQFESEVEALQAAQKKSKKDREKQERNEFLKNRIEKHRYHIKQLETLMRMLDNETVEVDQIKKIKDDIEYYIESSQDAEFQDNEFIYDELDLEDMQQFRANNVVDSTNVLAKSGSTTSASKNDNTNSSNNASVDNDDNIAYSNSSSANESPAPSPGLQNSHSTKPITTTSTSTNNNNSTTHEFAFITNTTPTTTTTTLTSTNSSTKTATVWSSSTAQVKSSSSSSITQSTCSVTSTPYATAVASSANSTTKILQTNDSLNDTRVQSMSLNSSSHHELMNHTNAPTPTVVPLYSAAAAAAAVPPVTSTASVSNNPWNSSTPVSNSAEISNQTNSRPPAQPPQQPNNSQMQLTPQQQQYILQQQQQQNNHVLNGYKNLSTVENIKGLAHQVSSNPGLEDHLVENPLISINMPTMNMSANSPNVNSMPNQMTHLNDLNSAPTQNSNPSMHMEHLNHLKTNLMHQRNPQMMPGNPPVSSVSPPNNISSMPTNVSTINLNNISNVDSKNVSSNINNLLNASQQIQSPNILPANFSNQPNKSALSKQVYFHLHLLESALRYPVLPIDSQRLKPITRLSPNVQAQSFHNHCLPQFDHVEFYQRLAPETLFFIFYYMEGSRAQYFAAKTLKNKSWRFHTKYMTWFQRLEEPRSITDDFETGTYIFFDFEKWTQRKKENFIFEYKYLEDKDLN